jgi:hypothetical protein
MTWEYHNNASHILYVALRYVPLTHNTRLKGLAP